MNNRSKALTAIVIYSILGAAVPAVTKIGLNEIPPISFAFVRFLIASLFALPLLHINRVLHINTIKEVSPVAIFATLNITFFVLGIKLTTANSSQILYAAIPIIIAVITVLIFKEKLSSQQLIGLLIGLIGVFLVVVLPLIQKTNPFSGNFEGNLLMIAAIICQSFYMAFSKKILNKYSPLTITNVFIILTTFVLFPLFVYQISIDSSWISSLSDQAIISLLYVALLGTIGTYSLTQYAIKHGGAVFASMAFYLGPIFTFLFSYILIGERLTGGVLLGGIFALLGVYIVTKKR